MTETVRACRQEDVPAVADLFARVLLKQRRPAGEGLRRYFDDLVFAGRPAGEEARSRVFVDEAGAVRGFIGIWPRRMLLDGRPIDAAAAGSLMVDAPERYPTAGARLLRAFLTGPQDFSFSETANGVSQRMWEKAGGERLAAASLDWLRVLRPAGLAIALARNAFAPAGWLRPVAAGVDRLLVPRVPALLPGPKAEARDGDASAADIARIVPQLSASYEMYPDWGSPDLTLLLAHAASKERYGRLYRRIVHGRGGEPVGCYLYYGRAGDVGRVLQVLARPDAVGVTLDSLFQNAADIGCVAVRGRIEPALFDPLIARRCLLFHVAAMMVHARDKRLLGQVQRSRVLLTGLAGESWTRLIGGEFA